MKKIPEDEIQVDFAKSGGPGGQKVNKTESKVIAHWYINGSNTFSDEEKKRIHNLLGNRINQDGEIFVSADEERSQHQNRERAISRLQEMVAGAIIPPKVRKSTKPSYTQKKKRLEEKRKQSQKKALRKSVPFD